MSSSASESTPLFSSISNNSISMNNSSSNNPNNTSTDSSNLTATLSQFAQSTFTKQNLEAATNYTKEKAVELKKQAQDGDHSLRFLGIIAGLGCIVVGFLELIARFMRLDLVGALIDFYIIVLGFIVVMLEGKNSLLPTKFVDNINKYALFLKFLWGRGALYFVIGTIQLYQFDLLNLIAGSYMCVVGVIYIIVGKRTAAKLKTLRKYIYSEHTLRAQFNEADVERDGLNVPQFRTLCFNLGLDLTQRESEAAFGRIQSKSNSQRLSYEDFQAWWNEAAEVDENAFAFV